MRFTQQRNKFDCGPAAIYNAAKAVNAPFTCGGYKQCFPELAEICYNDATPGTKKERILSGLRRALRGTRYTADLVYFKRCRWQWVLTRLQRDSLSVGIISARTSTGWHSAMIWIPPGDSSVWSANWNSHITKTALWFKGGNFWWPTVYAEVKLRAFWMVRLRK